MAELVGKSGGVCGGKGGSLHLADFKVGSLGESGIVGSSIPIATGAALSSKVLGNGRVSLAFFGDGAANQGCLYEAMNMAGVWDLPVVFLCENNQYALSTPAHTVTSGVISERAAGFGMPGVRVEDGQDVLAVHDAVSTAVERARSGEGPSLVEVVTYRFNEHSEGLRLGVDYRDADERAAWVERDPIVLFRRVLAERGVATEEELDATRGRRPRRGRGGLRVLREQSVPRPRDRFPRPLHRGLRAHPHDRSAVVSIMSYLGAIGAAQREAMEADERVVIIGEDVEANVYGTTGGSGKSRADKGDFLQMFGANRIRNTPISEEVIVGSAIGAAMTGLRPIVDLSYSSFLYMAMDQFVNQAAKNRYMFGGQASLPVVFRSAMFYGLNTGAHHSDRPYPMFMNVPGLKIVVPASPADAKGLLRAAVDSDDPVLIFEACMLWGLKGEVPDEEYTIPFGQARTVREGTDVTVVAISSAVPEALAAAESLAEDGISVEVIDPRTLVPLDSRAILESVAKTGRLVVADPAHRTCSAAAEIASIVVEEAFESLRAPIVRVTTPDTQIPFSPALEKQLYPSRAGIAEAVRKVTGERVSVPDRPGTDDALATQAPR